MSVRVKEELLGSLLDSMAEKDPQFPCR